MVVNHNIPALNTHLSMRRSDREMQKTMMRLSSGLKINSAREDAAGLAIANKLSYQVGGLNRASMNATHGISLIQTAEGALNEVHNMLQRMRELSVQAAHGTLTHENRGMIQLEIEELTAEIHSISRNTEYNRIRLLNGEGARVVDNLRWTSADETEATRSVVSTLFVSHQVPPGRLNYTIEQAGRGAMIELVPQIAPDEVFGEQASLSINGKNIYLSGKTWEEACAEINRQMPFMGMTMYTGAGNTAGSFFLVTNEAGEDQEISVAGSLELFGFPPDTNNVSDQGRSARVSIANPLSPEPRGLSDINGNPIVGSSLGNYVKGNNVQFLGSRGEDIRFNIQVMFDHLSGEFTFADRIPIDTLNADPLHMTKDFRDFGPIMLQIGPSYNSAMPVQIPKLNAETLGLVKYVGGQQFQVIDVRPAEYDSSRKSIIQDGAERAIEIAEAAIQTVSAVRARLGAYQNRLESTVRNLEVAAENTENSRSRIQDTDMARETTRFAQYNVMYQAAMSVLGQANQRPQQIIQLLQ